MKIFLLSPNYKTLFSDAQRTLLESSGELVIDTEPKSILQANGITAPGEKILAIDPDFCGWKVENEVIEKIPDLKAIVLQSTSFSWINTEFAKEKQIPVINLRGFSTVAVSEWATMMTLALARKLPLLIKNGWEQDFVVHQGMELRGKKAGIIGMVRIGSAIAENLRGLGMDVQYWSRGSKNEKFSYVDLKTLMSTSDVILPVVAQNKETQGLITDELLKSMKSSAIFVSVVHNIYNHDLLLHMIKTNKLYGYGFEEGTPSMLKYEGNIWAGPELAWCTVDSVKKNAHMWTEAIVASAHGDYKNRVN